MEEKYVALAIPFFLAAIAVEIVVSRLQRQERYAFQDSINSLSCGVGQQVLEPFLRSFGLAGYFYVYAHWRLATIASSSIVGWLVLLLGVDLAYYAFHRASHRVNFLWASHVVHHQSEEYNLSTALRQSWIEVLFQPVFSIPLALVGFHPLAFVTMSTFNTLYQFWIHTRAVKRIGVFEAFLNTPSHHRVHHGINPKYIDKNYGGMLIVWDRLFGTFEREDEEPVYGTVKPLASWNPLWANIHVWVEMAQMARAAARPIDKLKVWLMPPEWRPADLSNGVGYVVIPEVRRDSQVRYCRNVPRGLSLYVGVSFVLVAIATFAFLWVAGSAPHGVLAVVSALILLTLLSWGALFEAKRGAAIAEAARLFVSVFVIAWVARNSPYFSPYYQMIAASAGLVAMALAAWVLRYRARVTSSSPRPATAT